VTEPVVQPRSDVHGSASREKSRLQIAVVASIGQGQTPLSAFDAALWRCGVHSYNLLSLSSVVPPGSQIVVCDHYQAPTAEHGHKLYVVKAEMGSEEPGAVIAAGLGWLLYDDDRGVFVEHELHEPNGDCAAVERALTDQIMASLRDLAARRNVEFVAERAGAHIIVTRVERQPKSTIAVAIYQSEAWR
jgi:arginine decarboxylase